MAKSLFITDGAKHLNFVDESRNENWLSLSNKYLKTQFSKHNKNTTDLRKNLKSRILLFINVYILYFIQCKLSMLENLKFSVNFQKCCKFCLTAICNVILKIGIIRF